MKITITTIAVLAAGLSFAQDKNHPPKNPPSTEQLMKDLDVDKDGLISAREAKGPIRNDFKKLDLNQDGFLSKKELDSAPKPKNPPKNASNPQK